MSEINKVAITKFDPNPYQPKTRVEVTPQTAEFYGNSILQHGLLQIPLARQAPFGKKGERFEMGDGWLRLQGFKWLVEHGHLEYQEIPVDVRELTDEQMAHLVFEANGVRKNLDPIETAQYFKKYMTDFKCTEAQLAEKHSISQGEVANTMRLLQLPTEIQYLVGTGSVPQTHARHLLRLNVQPEEQKKMVQEVVKGSISVNDLSRKIDVHFWQNSRTVDPKADSYQKPKFNLGVCQGCVNRVQGQDPWNPNTKKEWRCILGSCWDKKQKEAEADENKKALEAAKSSKGKEKILTNKTIRNGAYEHLGKLYDSDDFDRSACKTCENKALFKYRLEDEDKPEEICLNPSCMRAKKSAFSRERNKAAKIKDSELTTTLGGIFHKAHLHPSGVMVVAARYVLHNLSADGKRDILHMFPTLPKTQNGQLDTDGLYAALAGKPLEDLTDLTAALLFTNHRRQHSYQTYSTEIKDEDLKFDLAQLDGTAKKHIEELTKWQETNCRGCNLATEILIGSGMECCHQTYNKKLDKAGNCEHGQKLKKPEKAAPVPETKGAISETSEPVPETKKVRKKTAKEPVLPKL